MDLKAIQKEINIIENLKMLNAFKLGVLAATGPLKNVSLEAIEIAINEISVDDNIMAQDQQSHQLLGKLTRLALEICTETHGKVTSYTME